MTPEQRADTLGDVTESSGDDRRAEVWRSEIAAAAIREAEAAAEKRERQACAALAEGAAGRWPENAHARAVSEQTFKPWWEGEPRGPLAGPFAVMNKCEMDVLHETARVLREQGWVDPMEAAPPPEVEESEGQP